MNFRNPLQILCWITTIVVACLGYSFGTYLMRSNVDEPVQVRKVNVKCEIIAINMDLIEEDEDWRKRLDGELRERNVVNVRFFIEGVSFVCKITVDYTFLLSLVDKEHKKIPGTLVDVGGEDKYKYVLVLSGRKFGKYSLYSNEEAAFNKAVGKSPVGPIPVFEDKTKGW